MLIALPALSEEKLDRGMIALERGDGSAYIGWRMLKDDAPGARFQLVRIEEGGDAQPVEFDQRTTNAVDRNVEKGKRYAWRLMREGDDKVLATAALEVDGVEDPYVKIPLGGDYDFQKIGVGDLNGDGRLEFLIKQPDFNTDPYQQPGYWKKSPTTYKIEAYSLDGEMLWRYDMGWAIEAGIWYSPWVVYDVDGDGKAEVYCKAGEGDPRDEKGLVHSGPEYLVKLDGETGKAVAKTDWITREGYVDYNRSCRNFLTIAYLDGKNPSLIMQRGTYKLIRTAALDSKFNPIWTWEATEDMPKYRGGGSHGLITADIDADGRDELVIGSETIDDNGKEMWTLGMGHPDVCYVADIDPSNPGLEIYYGFETRQDTDGVCLVDAKTGRKLWTHKQPTKHIHNQGMIGDVLAEYPGMETYSGERDSDERWFYSASGELIEKREGGTLSPRPVWWDADPRKEVVTNGAVRDWDQDDMQKLEGKLVAVMDCLGDWREEIITSRDGELRIYTTRIEADSRRPCLLQDHQYRLGVAAQTMGYYYPAQLGE